MGRPNRRPEPKAYDAVARTRKARLNQIGSSALRCLAMTAIAWAFAACQLPAPASLNPQPTAVDTPATDTPATDTPAAETPAAETPDLAPAAVGLIQLLDPLDEPEFYCVDVPGFGSSLNLQGALTAHTCKPGADDEMFQFDSPSAGQIQMPAYDLCVAASGPEPGADLILAGCSDSPLQKFSFNERGQIELKNGSDAALCLTVADEPGEPTGGPSHLRRDLTLETCELADEARTVWTAGSPTVAESEPATSE